MRTLMISLDPQILDPGSRAASRMRAYGHHQTLDIIIPTVSSQEVALSETVRVWGSGGTKLQQFWRLLTLGKKLTGKQHYDSITAQDPFITGWTALRLRQPGTAVEVQLHGDFFSSAYYRHSGFKNLVYYIVARWLVVPRADRIRVVGERVKESILGLGISESNVYVQPVPVPFEHIAAYVPKDDVHQDYPGFRKIFLFLGRLEPVKNPAWLIKIFSDYLDSTNESDVLLIAGDGHERTYLEYLARRRGVDQNIRFIGWLKNPLDYLKTVDAVLIPSLSEGYGLVAMEAQAAGAKIIMTDTGVANYELKPSDRVVIVPVGDRQSFIQAMESL